MDIIVRIIFLIIIPVCAILIYIAKKSKNNHLYSIGIVGLLICFTIFMGILIPYLIIDTIYGDFSGFILLIVTIFVFWMIIYLTIGLKNQLTFFDNNTKDIYIRDIDVKYSPAVLSYLMNNKIETKKDLTATILNLCSKNVLRIEKDNNGKVNIIDLKNKCEVEKLSADEKYAYEMLNTNITNKKIEHWKNTVEKEYEKYKFSKPQNAPLVAYIWGVIFTLTLCFLLCSYITIAITGHEIDINIKNIFSKVITIVFLAAIETGLFSMIKTLFYKLLYKKQNNEFKDTYTNKGAKEYIKWKKFETFIKDYSFINEKDYKDIVLWGKYLSYSIVLGINKKCDNELYKQIKKDYSFDYNILVNLFEE